MLAGKCRNELYNGKTAKDMRIPGHARSRRWRSFSGYGTLSSRRRPCRSAGRRWRSWAAVAGIMTGSQQNQKAKAAPVTLSQLSICDFLFTISG